MQRSRLVVGVVVGSMLMVACSSSSKSSSSTPPTTAAASSGTPSSASQTTAAPSGNTAGSDEGVSATSITIGLINPDSGSLGGQFAAYADGVKAAINSQNSAGGVNGRKLNLIAVDDQANPSLGLPDCKNLINNDHAFGLIIGSFFAADSCADFLLGKGAPVTGWGFTPSFRTHANYFGEGPSTYYTDQSQGSANVINWAFGQGAKKVAVLAMTDPYGPPGEKVNAAVIKHLGGQVVYENLSIPLVNANFTPIAQSIKSSGANFIEGGLNEQALVLFGKALAEAGVHPIVDIPGEGYQQDVLTALGSAGEGMTFITPYTPFELKTPAIQKEMAAVAAVAPGEGENYQALLGWMGAQAFIEGLTVAGQNPTRAAFIANLRQVHDYTAGGLEPPLDYSTIQSVVPTCDYLISIKGGKFAPVANTPFCAPLIKLS